MCVLDTHNSSNLRLKAPIPLTASATTGKIEHMYAYVGAGRAAGRPAWQGGLFGGGEPAVDPTFAGIRRVELDEFSWYDVLPGWLSGADTVFAELVERLAWRQRKVPMYERIVDEPRLIWWWTPATGRALPMPVMSRALAALDDRYQLRFDSIGCNFYRDGRDSVAFHGDRHRHWVTEPVIAIVSVGEARPFQIRPCGGGRARTLQLGGGDLFVMGGASQDRWEHAVPKVVRAGPRISITYRHGTGDFQEESERETGAHVRER